MDKTCKYQTECPEFIEQKEDLKNYQKGSRTYKDKLTAIKKSICNKKQRAVCCPNPLPEDKCGRGYSCLKEAQCKYAQDLRKKFNNGDKKAKQELIGLICDRKDQTFRCPDLDVRQTFSDKKSSTWLPGKGECGISKMPPSNVIGGVNTNPGQFPFTALLGYPITERRWIENKQKWGNLTFTKYKCGGTLINQWYVVTAAHCRISSSHKMYVGDWHISLNKIEQDCMLIALALVKL